MIKRVFVLTCCVAFFGYAQAQNIAPVKMQEVVDRFSKTGDSIYVVNFWATFCKPCVGEIPGFIKVTEKYKDQKVKLLLVSLDLKSYYPAKIAAFTKSHHFTPEVQWLSETNADLFCPLIDPKWSGAIPSTIIVNARTGKKYFFEEEMTEAELEKRLLKAMEN